MKKCFLAFLCGTLISLMACSKSLNSNVVGSMDGNACNYNSKATIQSFCMFPEEHVNCKSECFVTVNCLGECGGSARQDFCGVCDRPV